MRKNTQSAWGTEHTEKVWYIRLPNGAWLTYRSSDVPVIFVTYENAEERVVELVTEARKLGVADYRPEIFIQTVTTSFGYPTYDHVASGKLTKIIGEG